MIANKQIHQVAFTYLIKVIIPHVLTNKPPQDWKIKHSGGIMLLILPHCSQNILTAIKFFQ
ncbi:hypothetical protein ELO79_22610 [Salmonella enterica subsp. enterica serovar Schwarzengrund]|nr:hypothetical protein [Salmonella enterica subsp. enterica serovar Schwarzengrund]